MSRHRPHAPRRTARGAGLVELLVAVLLLAVGGLSVAMAQMASLRRVQGAMLSTTAVHASVSLAEAMRANRAAVIAGEYDTAGELCAAGGGGSGASLAQRDLQRWVVALATGMGDNAAVCGSVQCDAGRCTLGVHWDDSRAAGGPGAARTRLLLGVAP